MDSMHITEEQRFLTEEQFLEALSIPDFRHLSYEKLINVALLAQLVEEDILEKALMEFPDFPYAVYKRALEAKTYAAGEPANNATQYISEMADFLLLDVKNQIASGTDIPFSKRRAYLKQFEDILNVMSAYEDEKEKSRKVDRVGNVINLVTEITGFISDLLS